MCSVNEEFDDAVEIMPEEETQATDDALCQKCNSEKAGIVLRGKDVYCDKCFLASATHKFRATLGKSKIVRPNDKILVAYAGNAGSTALLHLIRAGMHESVHKRLVFETKVVYIDDGAIKGYSVEDRKTRARKIGAQVDSLGFESYGISLNESLKETHGHLEKMENLSNSLAESADEDERLKDIFAKLPEHTSRLELLHKLRQKLLFSSARRLGCNKVFLSDNSTSLAIDILSNVALGRGAQLSLDVGFLDTRHKDVTLLRPMRDFTRHELDCYLKIHSLEIVDWGVYLGESANLSQSIQGLTDKFITDLDSRFHGTVSTVFRTGEKVCSGSRSDNKNSDETCVLCDAPLDTLSSDTVISAIQATAFSRLVSSQGPRGNVDFPSVEIEHRIDDESKGCGKCNGSCSEKSNKRIVVTPEELGKFLCYGCRLIFRNSSTDDLPTCVVNAVVQRLALENMREEITDFLL